MSINRADHPLKHLAAVRPKKYQNHVRKAVSARSEPFSTMANVFRLNRARAHCAEKHSNQALRLQRIAIRAAAFEVYGLVRMLHVVLDVVPLEIRIIRHLMENGLILWENVHIIF